MSEISNEFKVLISSNLEYEKMVVYIQFLNDQVAVLSCDDGIDKMVVEIQDRFVERVMWRFDYKEFMKTLQNAFEELKKINSEE